MTSAPKSQQENQSRLLVVDDDAGQRSLLQTFLSGQGYTVDTREDGEAAIRALESGSYAMMISDVRMPGMTGLEALQALRAKGVNLPVLLVTAYADVRDAVSAMRDGAVNYLEKPIDLDELLESVQKALGKPEEKVLPAEIDGMDVPAEIIARSESFRAALREAALVAPSESRVLITGESGVGKEVVADLIHQWSPRRNGPLVKVNCAAIPSELLESELFGHEKGAFTGATARRIGRFEEARDGTILLDEVAEIPPALQAKLLRVTQNGSFQRIGANAEHHTNARILAATNRNLETEVRDGRFREDLFFRLNVIEIFVPPLRDRAEDIMPLANAFAREFSQASPRFSPGVTATLGVYNWPGNVRELRNAMERAVLMSRGGVILPEHLPRRIQSQTATPETEAESSNAGKMEDVERVVILQTLREQNFNRTATAQALGISRRNLQYKIRRYKKEGYAIEDE
ncbi:MAG: sigma-54-dependent transcriptional regulator [Candidatus Sumerlaeia bacterium]